MGKPLDPDYFKKYRASHPEYAARDRARRNLRRYAHGPRDRSAEYARRNALRNHAPAEPLQQLYPDLNHGTSVAFWEDELRMDIEQEKILAVLEGKDPEKAAKTYATRELAWHWRTVYFLGENQLDGA